jgi:hypothetical protein
MGTLGRTCEILHHGALAIESQTQFAALYVVDLCDTLYNVQDSHDATEFPAIRILINPCSRHCISAVDPACFAFVPFKPRGIELGTFHYRGYDWDNICPPLLALSVGAPEEVLPVFVVAAASRGAVRGGTLFKFELLASERQQLIYPFDGEETFAEGCR